MFNWTVESLEELRWHWGEAYLIDHMGSDEWIAQRRDDRTTLRAESADGLFTAIRADYQARPVRRRVGAGEA